MLKPVSILALDEVVAPLAYAVQQRVAAHYGVDDLVQARDCHGVFDNDPEAAIQSIHAQRQRPDTPLRLRDDIGTRELVLVMLAAAGSARTSLLETVRRIRTIYETRRFASFVSIEILCMLPEAAGPANPEDYAAAYALLKALSAEDEKPFAEVWLVDATNAKRVRFGAVDASLDVYADAIAGALMYEPELSGALQGHPPRGMHPTFSSFGYASLVFPRELAVQRVEARFAAELVQEKLLAGARAAHAQLAAKQFIVAEEFALPLSRIGVDAGQSLFRRFQPKTQVTERTRSAEEIIAAVRGELQAFRDTTQLRNLDTLTKQGEQTVRDHSALLARSVDETLDRDGYDTAIGLLEALLDPLPELRADAEPAPRNLVSEIRTATAALDARLHFTANTGSSDAARKRVRELATLIEDQQVVADTLAPTDAAEQVQSLEREKASLLAQVPELIFAEERENSAGRTAARESETARLAAETAASEQELRELFARLPRTEQALREALETRRSWLWQQLIFAVIGAVAIIAIGFVRPLQLIWVMPSAFSLFAVITGFRYMTQIAPLVRDARERLARLRSQIETADQTKNAAHNAELQVEYDVSHRRTALRVLRAIHDAAKELLDALRARREELAALAESFARPSLVSGPLSLSVVDDDDVDAWYARTVDDRKPFAREFPIRRPEARRLSIDELRRRIASHAATAFPDLRKLTLAMAASTLANEVKLVQRLKRLADVSGPLIELREDDLQAQRSIQHDCTLWLDSEDATWIAQLQRRFPEATVRSAPDALSVHAITRVLHYPGYVLGPIDYYRAQYEAAANPEHADVADLIPAEVVFGTRVHTAYEQVLLARALGIVNLSDGKLSMSDSVLGDTHLAAAQLLAAPESAAYREQLADALAPRVEMTDVTRELRTLRQSATLTPVDRTVLDGLLKKYATLV
ncbi:MAG TPA: hypothetical protein VGQ76_13980 [Thermoanaerobaculia bacterium]|jgi:hypothetical protein|nr:hypothetical protein [Thermoanaerobaculia bacterium]